MLMTRVLDAEELELLLNDRAYTIEEIDKHLFHIVNVIKYSRKRDKEKCFDKANLWLDRRLQLTQDAE